MKPCPSRRRELGELTDGTLSLRDRERLNAHLVECAGCRDEAASLRRVRDQLRIAGSAPSASSALTDRLLSIAGPKADQPLYARPFDRSGVQTLPSRRRRTRQAVVSAMALTCLVLVGFVGVGWAAAPPTHTQVIDPGPVAREEFAAVLAQAPLSNPAITAARAAEASREKTDALTGPEASAGPMTTKGAQALLERADEARLQIAYAGFQTVQVRHLAGYWVTDVEVEARPGRGIQVALPDRSGATRSVLLTETLSTGISGSHRVAGLARTHDLVTGPGPVVADRPTAVVEARQAGRSSARWWLDTETGLVLWQQTLDERGDVTMSAGYRSISVGPIEDPRHLPPRLAPRGSTANLTLASVDDLADHDARPTETIAGLPLVRARGDRRESMLHTVYGDGVVTVSVFQHKGALAGAPKGFVWDPRHRAYRSLGLTTMYAWQSGDTVFTVATDGSSELAETAVAELPHSAPVLQTRTDRVLDGWRTLVGAGR